MTDRRTDRATRVIEAAPTDVYQAFIDPGAWIEWLPPEGMTGYVHRFDARPGGGYRLVLRYDEAKGSPGKSSGDADVVEGTFIDLVADDRVVQSVTFESDDPAFAGDMRMTWSVSAHPAGALVEILAEDVPPGIRAEDHQAAFASTLEKLAAYLARSK